MPHSSDDLDQDLWRVGGGNMKQLVHSKRESHCHNQYRHHHSNHNHHSHHHHHHRRRSNLKMKLLSFSIVLISCMWQANVFVANSLAFNQIVVLEPASGNGSSGATRYSSALSGTIHHANQIQASFSTPNQAINITHVTYDPLYDTLYLGATNAIYQLNGSDLSEQFEQTTGPVFDNPSCGITDCRGYEDFMKPTQNVNKILVIDYQHKKLLSCGSTKQGACRRYQLNNISQKEDLVSMAVAANDDNSSTYAFIAPARYTYDPSTSTSSANTNTNNASAQQQQVLYVASTYTKVGQSRDLLVPAIGTRILDDGPNLLKLYENSFLDSARIDINSHLRDYFLVNYLYGFASSNYIYFVTVQKKATSRDYEELGYHTRLARICITDSSYNSYTEVDLKCVPNRKRSPVAKHGFFGSQQQQQLPNEYPLLQDAILVDAGSQLLQSLAQNDQSSPLSADFFYNTASNGGSSGSGSSSQDEGKVLLGVFSSARDHTQHAGEHSALCAFSLAQIEDKFNDNIHNCYTGKMQSRNMEYIAGNVQECPKSGQGGNVVNFCHETLKINGTIPIISEASIQFQNTTLTAITATSHVGSNLNKNIYSDQLANELSQASSAPQAKPASKFYPGAAQQQQQQNTVVFMGTSSGHIKKVLLNNASNGIEFEDVQVDTNPILSDLHLHSSGQHLFAATPYKVMKIPTYSCGQYSTCRECSQSRNPYCGWCSLKRSCTTKNECLRSEAAASSASATQQQTAYATSESSASRQLKWISNESAGKCIDLQSIVPDKIPITSTGKVELFIDRLPRLPKEHNYKCIFDRKEQTTAALMPYGLSCPLPKVMHRPKIQPGRDHATVDLAVRSSETNTDFLNGKMTFFECQLHTTCKDCLTANWGCNWCINENICLFNTSKCEKTGSQARSNESAPLFTIGTGPRSTLSSASAGVVAASSGSGRQSNTINQVSQCPTFDVDHKQDILIADGSERELVIKVKNMPQFKGAIKCIVEVENDKISLKARIEENRVICENSTYSYAADVGLLNGQLVVSYSDSNIFIDRTNFTLYKCHLLGAYLNRPDCSLCQRIDRRFECSWCSNACHHRSRCGGAPEEACPAPRIDFVHPTSGPTFGGTKVVIEGSNLGQSFEDIVSRVSIGNVPCKPVEDEYRPSNKIVCITGPIVSRQPVGAGSTGSSLTRRPFDFGAPFDVSDTILGDVMVGNKAGYSLGPSKFQYKSIYLRDHQPRYGPQSGGTRITLTGVNLNIGSDIQVFLDELACQVELATMTSEQVVCITAPSRHASRTIRQLRLIIDDAQITRDEDVFYYMQDPVVTKIYPLRSYLSGGRPINVLGTNLTAIQTPRMAIIDAVGKKLNETTCILQDDTRMICPSPTVNLAMMDLEWSEQHIGSTYEASSSTWTPIAPSIGMQATTGSSSLVNGVNQVSIQHEESVKFKISFIMDNVYRLRDLQASYPALNSEISYTNDPKLFPFASQAYKLAQEAALSQAVSEMSASQQALHNQQLEQQSSYQVESDTYLLLPGEPLLILYGEQLRGAVSEYEITVTVGRDLCNFTQLTQTRLICLMPLDHMATPTDEDGHQTARELPLVVVRIGLNLRFELGYVQYHPVLADQIFKTFANSSEQLAYMRPTYPQYMPRENESFFHKLSNFITTSLLILVYMTLVVVLVALVYSGLQLGHKFKQRSQYERNYKRIQSKIGSLEKSVRGECRIASLALQSDLNELVRHIDLSGVPVRGLKQFIARIFFPAQENQQLLAKLADSAAYNGNGSDTIATIEPMNNQQALAAQRVLHNQPAAAHAITGTIQRPLKGANRNSTTSGDFPMDHFERLILTKPFLVTFINTLEQHPALSGRDKANVASLIMIILMGRLDYATDILRTLIFQLVERSVASANQSSGFLKSADSFSGEPGGASRWRSGNCGSSLTRRASNLLSGLPISKRGSQAAAELGKVMGDNASSLMASTTVAAQMLLSRVGNKTSPPQPAASQLQQQQQHQQQRLVYPANNLPASALLNDGLATTAHCMSTTTFNATNGGVGHLRDGVHTISGSQAARSFLRRPAVGQRGYLSSRPVSETGSGISGRSQECGIHQLLGRKDSIVEAMLTNWLALNMYDHFQGGNLGHSLYMLFEALKCQLERGPVDSVSGDAYYSLSDSKLLREPHLQFDLVNLYVIVDTNILRPSSSVASGNNNNVGSLIDGSTNSPANYGLHQQNSFYQSQDVGLMTSTRSTANYTAANTITLTLRVLDCDSISQVKGKILGALYRNSPYSSRLGVNDVELSLRQPQPISAGQQQGTGAIQYINVQLSDEDYTSATSYNGIKRVNTLRHYGVTDQAIMRLNRCARQRNSSQMNNHSALTEMLDDHYNNPYAEIQYGGMIRPAPASTRPMISVNNMQPACGQTKTWHLIRGDKRSSHNFSEFGQSNESSPSSHSPSMMLLGNENQHQIHPHNQAQQAPVFNAHPSHQHHPYYHPSSSSTSSTGNVMDTNSTSANSSSMNVGMFMKSRTEQPIYCQIGGSSTLRSQQGGASSNYYCQIATNPNEAADYQDASNRCTTTSRAQNNLTREQENEIYLTRMLASKGTIQSYLDDFFSVILNAKQSTPASQNSHDLYNNMGTVLFSDNHRTSPNSTGAFSPAIKWLFDLLDEAAIENGVTDPSVTHSWKSNALLVKFWANLIKNPNLIMDVEKSEALDATLSTVAQTLVDSCSMKDCKLNQESTCNRLLFAKDLPRYKNLVRKFYQDIGSMRPVSDQEMIKHLSSRSMANSDSLDTNVALKELCVYAVNYGVDLMAALNGDFTCQQLELSQQLEQCFRSFTIFEAY